MAAGLYNKIGYGQVEPNHLSAQRNGRIYAQLPCEDKVEKIENGMFLKYDRFANSANSIKGINKGLCTANINSPAEWGLVYNEVHTYDTQNQGYKDYALLKQDLLGTNGPTDWKTGNRLSYNKKNAIFPRIFGIENGDAFTTNLFYSENTANMPNVGDIYCVGVYRENCVENTSNSYNFGVLVPIGTTTSSANIAAVDKNIQFAVVAQTTMPDGQKAIKVQKVRTNLGTYTNNAGFID